MEEENQGSLLLGMVLGFFLGCIGIVIAFALKGQKTLTGSIIGMVVSICLWGCLSVGMVVLQMVLMNA